MGKPDGKLRTAADAIRVMLLFILNVCYIFASLGLFAFGFIMLPAVLIGRTGFLVMTTDLAPLPLLLISAGVLLLGLGMCICIIPMCSASYAAFRQIMRAAEIRAGMRAEASPDSGENTDSDETAKDGESGEEQ